MGARYERFEGLLGEAGAAAMLRLCERLPAYGIYHDQPIAEGIGAGLLERHDAVRNYLRDRGRIGAEVPDDTEIALLLFDEYIHFP